MPWEQLASSPFQPRPQVQKEPAEMEIRAGEGKRTYWSGNPITGRSSDSQNRALPGPLLKLIPYAVWWGGRTVSKAWGGLERKASSISTVGNNQSCGSQCKTVAVLSWDRATVGTPPVSLQIPNVHMWGFIPLSNQSDAVSPLLLY